MRILSLGLQKQLLPGSFPWLFPLARSPGSLVLGEASCLREDTQAAPEEVPTERS